MITGKTKTGFEFEISESIGSDARLGWYVAMAEDSDESTQIKAYRKLMLLIFGSDDKIEKLFEHIASLNSGSVPQSALNAEMADVILASKDLKNS